MRYSEELIEEVRSRNDIVDVISGYVKLKKSGSNYFGLCPFHNEKSGSFSVSPSKQMYYCFGCGAGGNVITFIMEYENYTFMEAVRMLAERAGIELPQMEETPEERKSRDIRSQLLEINKLAAVYYFHQLRGQNGSTAMNYLKKRELGDETIQRFGLGYSSMYSDDLYRYIKSKGYKDDILKESGLFTYGDGKVTDKFWNRVMFPIMDMNNRVIGFGGRVMGDGKPKYLNSPETKLFDKSRNLYGLNIARTSRKPNIIICEGYMDVISLHQAGFNQAVASLGTALTSGQASLMKRYTDQVLITYDSDGAGVKAALRAIPILKEAGLTTKVINMKPYKDPDEFIKGLGAEAFQERIDKAQNSFMYEISAMEQNYDLTDPDSKTRFFNEVAGRIVGFEEELERNNYIEAVADKYMVSMDALKAMVGNYGNRVGIVKDRHDSRRTSSSHKEKEDGISQAQKILLTWLVQDMSLYPKVAAYLSPDDFIEEPFHDVAVRLYEQLDNGQINPAAIISTFDDGETQKKVASIFNRELAEELSDSERERALNQTVKKIKKNSLDIKSRSVTDVAQLQNIIKEQKEIQNIQIHL
ncbi:DNA primase [[Bacteroides] pectinophilus]|jgi:DNA primase|uniref:DNA primase n=1 Tax=[Bacteroides] pectinophilus ATCC 43243 TaxID=483218 RepID=B7AQM9_9FIRM|nr:DNA primase [[Bacteroides] pectinophilus ATCC 43243]UWN96771.1 DNA primase [[Bacteroides] pectinophilus]